jgi:hypothetical protein
LSEEARASAFEGISPSSFRILTGIDCMKITVDTNDQTLEELLQKDPYRF